MAVQEFAMYGKSEQKQYSGKNLIKYPYSHKTNTQAGVTFTDVGDGTILINGSNTKDGTLYFNLIYDNTNYILLQAGTYTLSLGEIHTNIRGTISKFEDNSLIAGISASEKYRTFTLTKETKIRFVIAIDRNLSVNNVTIYPQIELSSQPTDYEPYVGGKPSPSPEYPQEIESVGDDGSVEVELINENLFDLSKLKYLGGNILIQDDILYNANNSTVIGIGLYADSKPANNMSLKKGKVFVKFKIKGETNTTIKNSFLCSVSNNGNRNYGNPKSFNVTNNFEEIALEFTTYEDIVSYGFAIYHTVSTKLYIKDIIVSETDTEYNPHKHQSISITTPKPLRSIGDIHDELRVFKDGSGEIVRRIGVSGENFEITEFENVYRYGINANNCVNGSKLLCKYTNNYSSDYNGDFVHCYVWNKVWLFLPKDSQQPKKGDVIYQLATPIIEPLTAEQVQQILNLHTYKPTTNIFNSDNAEMEITYIADTKTYIDNKIGELESRLIAVTDVITQGE